MFFNRSVNFSWDVGLGSLIEIATVMDKRATKQKKNK